MSVDDILHFLEQLVSSSGLPLESLSFDQLTDILANADIDIADFSSDQIESVFAALGFEPDVISDGLSDDFLKSHTIATDSIDPSQYTDQHLNELVTQHGFNDSYSLTSYHANQAVSFSGLEHTDKIAGYQGNNPWCGIHSVGNFVQEFYPDTGEWVNNHIFNLAASQGGLVPTPEGGFSLSKEHYQPMLEGAFNIPCHWETFDPNRVADLLNSNHGVLAIGDAHDLNPSLYTTPNAFHAFNLTDVKINDQGQVWYKGLDSNIPGKESWWPADAIQQSLAKGHAQYGDNILVTNSANRWPWKNS